jgi:hypothetical protein
MTREWELMFPIVLVHKKPREMSNHNPLIVSTRHSQVSHTREFRFELTWVSHPDFLPKVQELWDLPTRDIRALDRFLYRLKKVK